MEVFRNLKKTNLESIDFIFEFVRYLFVGGSAFLVDTGVLFLTKKLLFFDLGKPGILIATALGFIAGLIYNYILSILFVFKGAEDKVKSKQLKSFIIFALIGVIGLGLTEGGMCFGITLFGDKYYLIVKIFVASVVLFWNYIARKIFIFK
ncbi:GtrA family protein [Acetivibrio cellulolyticus]|uniref:GtrA family protein n=1 Tax=Acetivibrio cellulolyticus TaxID=35830 RepID=UPI0001E2C1CB|nr:GtrA family protein [Acetivibrio cellulolyticus]